MSTPLFDQYFEDNKKALKDANKDLLAEDIKMTLTASVHNAKKAINRISLQLNTERANLENINFAEILSLKTDIKDAEDQIESAQEEFELFFGEAMA